MDSNTIEQQIKKIWLMLEILNKRTTQSFGDMKAATYDPAGVSEQLVGEDAIQTLMNKTMAYADNTFTGFPDRSYALHFGCAFDNPVDATTYFFGDLFSQGFVTASGSRQIYIPKAGTIKAVYGKIINASPGTGETSSIYVRLNNTTDTLITAGIDDSIAVNNFSNNSLSITVAQGDYIEIKWITPTWVTNPLLVIVAGVVYIE